VSVEGVQQMSGVGRIGVVGGGASAVCLLDALSQRDLVPHEVTVFEPSPYLWRGRAYQPDAVTVRVNAPPDDMSVRFGDPAHFESWVTARDLVLSNGSDSYEDPWSGIRFPPRAMFGDYLEQAARAAMFRLVDRGCRIELVRDFAVSAELTPGGLDLFSGRGERYAFDHAVLCVGGGRPADLYNLGAAPGFVADPYPVAWRLAEIPADDDVTVIGSGLTAIDVVLSLAARGHTGRISLVSRRGVLPAVRQRQVHYELGHFTPARFRAMAARGETCTLEEVLGTMRAELVDAGVSPADVGREVFSVEAEDPISRLRRQFESVGEAGLGMRILQRAVPDTGPDVWPLLPEQDKDELLRGHYRTIMSLCCPMPPSSAATLLSLADSGQLEVVRGLREIVADPGGGFQVLTEGGNRKAAVVVNAVNAPGHKIPVKADPLVSSLVQAGAAELHPRGGVHVERATSRLTVDGRPDSRVYALGDLAAGSLFFTFGVPSLVDRAYDIAEAIGAGAESTVTAAAMQAV
jgi:uncharacterized NAD(P)/FAD-binding protein YdhS